ncbi:DUF1572 family protein [Daejeonella lutea]|uniref:DinB superfamily protein n=1 Tax=Daejeonella lutea TaxID=572036 RepID=A0A1T5AYM7_9SPHI|nr:DUF1572 family protein [Daejeonella lutea]SKB40066.1 Protein of unknown function [Daejeonella lutea]
MKLNYLKSVISQLENYKSLGERTFDQVTEDKLFWQYNAECNSMATIVKHLWGNMLSRWTSFLNSDGEKEWRNRDAEFDNDLTTKREVLDKWNEGWTLMLETINSLHEDDLEKTVYIRNEAHTVVEAINRSLAHSAYHVGQLVFIGKMSAENWTSLTVPRGGSRDYNAKMFSKTDEPEKE